jgi:hypothetical protein
MLVHIDVDCKCMLNTGFVAQTTIGITHYTTPPSSTFCCRQTSIKMKQQERETLLIRDKMLMKRLATLQQNKIREAKEDTERKQYMQMLAGAYHYLCIPFHGAFLIRFLFSAVTLSIGLGKEEQTKNDKNGSI